MTKPKISDILKHHLLRKAKPCANAHGEGLAVSNIRFTNNYFGFGKGTKY